MEYFHLLKMNYNDLERDGIDIYDEDHIEALMMMDLLDKSEGE